jgi:hypothetical protein
MTDQPTLRPVIKPAEHCGDISPGPLGCRSECVLRPGHSGSHADDQGGRWWEDPGRTTPDNPATSSDTADSPLQQLLADAVRPWLLDADDADEADVQHCAAAVAAAILPTTRLLGALHKSAHDDITRVINLHERWQQIDLPKDRESRFRWWDRRLAELHNAILPPDQPAPAATEATDTQGQR